MAYEPINWVNLVTPLNARNFNHMEDGIAEADIESSTIAVFESLGWDNPETKIISSLMAFIGEKIGQDLWEITYPVGSYYETTDSELDPNVNWGGTWLLETEGQVHVSAGDNYAVAGALTNTSDGGASTVTLDVTQMPSHTHTQNAHSHGQDAHAHALREQSNSVASGSAHGRPRTDSQTQLGYGYWTSAAQPAIWGATATNNYTGGGKAHNNMQPYINVYRWHRTA